MADVQGWLAHDFLRLGFPQLLLLRTGFAWRGGLALALTRCCLAVASLLPRCCLAVASLLPRCCLAAASLSGS